MTKPAPQSEINQTTDYNLKIVPTNNDTIQIEDPALKHNEEFEFKIPSTPSIYSTEINDRKNQKIIQVTNFTLLEPAGNIGEIQYNSEGKFTADANLKWNSESKLLHIGGDLSVGNTISSLIEANSNISFNIGNTDSYQFTTDGKFKTPHFYFPYNLGLSGQALISDGSGGLFWDTVNTPFSRIQSITGATGVVVHNLSDGFNFSHTNILNNFTVNITNITGLLINKTIAVTLILMQSNPPYLPIAFQINGIPHTVNWSDNQPPTGFADKKEIIVYNIFNENSVYKVYGHYTAYSPAS